MTKKDGCFIYILYADDAGNTGTDYDNVQQPVFSLAGIVVHDSSWSGLNEEINDLKRRIIPCFPNAELHATDIFNGKRDKKGRFDFRRNSPEQNREILASFVDFVVVKQLPVLYFSVRKEQLKKYCALHFGGAVKLDPYLIAFPYMTSFFDHYVTRRNDRGLIMLDEQNAIVSNIDTAFSMVRLAKTGGAAKGFHAHNIIERALFLESAKSNFIQLADVCNFYINRYISMENGIDPAPDKQQHFRKMWQKLKPLIVEPPFDPYQETKLFCFFEDNKEVLGKKEQPAP